MKNTNFEVVFLQTRCHHLSRHCRRRHRDRLLLSNTGKSTPPLVTTRPLLQLVGNPRLDLVASLLLFLETLVGQNDTIYQ